MDQQKLCIEIRVKEIQIIVGGKEKDKFLPGNIWIKALVNSFQINFISFSSEL